MRLPKHSSSHLMRRARFFEEDCVQQRTEWYTPHTSRPHT